MLFEHLGQQPIHGATATGDLLHDIGAVRLRLQGALNRLDLAFDTPDAVQELCFSFEGVSHGGWFAARGGRPVIIL